MVFSICPIYTSSDLQKKYVKAKFSGDGESSSVIPYSEERERERERERELHSGISLPKHLPPRKKPALHDKKAFHRKYLFYHKSPKQE